MHPSYGKVPPEVFLEAKDAPAMKAAKILRPYDPLFGREKGKTSKYCVTVSRKVVYTEEARVYVDATTDDEAREIVDNMTDWDGFQWDDDGSPEIEDCGIEYVDLAEAE